MMAAITDLRTKALTCCAVLPSTRLKAAGIIGGLYPASLGLTGMLFEARMLLWVAPWVTTLVEKGLDWSLGTAARDAEHPENLEKLLADGMKGRPEADRAVWDEDERGFCKMLIASVRDAVKEGGAKGAAWEANLFGNKWGFELEDVKMEKGKLIMWHGSADTNSPVAMAEKAHALLQNSELRVVEGEAHASLFVHSVEEVLDTLKERMDW